MVQLKHVFKTLFVHVEMKLKLQNISSCVVIFTLLIEKNSLKALKNLIHTLNPKNQVLVLLYGSQINDSKSLNRDILKNVIIYIKATARFDRPLINVNQRIFSLFPMILILFLLL